MLAALAVGVFFLIEKETIRAGSISINGNVIPGVTAKIRNKDALLPFTEVLRGFGFNLVWRDNNTADITYENKMFVLDVEEASLVEEGFDYNLLDTPPGSIRYYCKPEGRELVTDSDTVNSVMYDLGKKIDIDIDRDKLAVYVSLRED